MLNVHTSCLSAAFGMAIVVASAAGASAQDSERAEQILNRNCTSCHNLRRVETQALDINGWTKVLEAEFARGATLPKDDVPVLLTYLTRNHGPLPEGAGKQIVLQTCTQCHDLSRVREHRATAEEWLNTLEAMLNEGAPISDDELPVVLRYLARNFKPD
jgi:cytochrome c5